MIDFQYSKILLITLLLSASVFSQGEFLQKGTDGLSLQSGYRYGEDYYDFNGRLGYSINGIFDFGIGITKGISQQKILHYDLNKLSLNPYIALTDHSSPLILSVNFAYRHDFINSDAFDVLDIKAEGDYYSVGSSIRARILESSSFFIQPLISADYIAGRDKAFNNSPISSQTNIENLFNLSQASVTIDSIYQEIPTGQTRSDFMQELILNFGVDFCYKASDRMLFYITPNFRLLKTDKFIGVNAGLVLPIPLSKNKPFENKQIEVPAIPQQKVIYLNIENVLKRHFLVYINNKTPMKEGDAFYVVRTINRNGVSWNKIGVARVAKIQDNKAVFESDLYDENDQVTTKDKLLYRY